MFEDFHFFGAADQPIVAEEYFPDHPFSESEIRSREEREDADLSFRRIEHRRFSQGSADSEYPDPIDNSVSATGALNTGEVRGRLPLVPKEDESISEYARCYYPSAPRRVRLAIWADRIAQRTLLRAQLLRNISSWDRFSSALGRAGELGANLYDLSRTEVDLARGQLFELDEANDRDTARIQALQERAAAPNPVNPAYVRIYGEPRP